MTICPKALLLESWGGRGGEKNLKNGCGGGGVWRKWGGGGVAVYLKRGGRGQLEQGPRRGYPSVASSRPFGEAQEISSRSF